MENGKLTEEEIQEAIKTDPEAIEYRELIENINRMMGNTYAKRIKEAYLNYINEKYR